VLLSWIYVSYRTHFKEFSHLQDAGTVLKSVRPGAAVQTYKEEINL
jgi:hypothetical protein